MSRKLLMMMAASLTVTACDPFQLVEPRSDYRRTPPPRQQLPPSERWNAPDDMRRADDPQPPGWNSDESAVTERYPVAQRTEIPGRVISPHPPYNVLDVSEYQSGQLVRDPTSNDEIFRVP